MEKVKIFVNTSKAVLNSWGNVQAWIEEINNWIKQTPGITISKVTFDLCEKTCLNSAFFMQISIFYNKSHFSTHKDSTRLKMFFEPMSVFGSSNVKKMEKDYESWFENQPKKLSRSVGKGVCAVTEFEIRQVINKVLSPFIDYLALLVVYTDCTNADEEPKIKKGPPKPIVLPRREG